MALYVSLLLAIGFALWGARRVYRAQRRDGFGQGRQRLIFVRSKTRF